MDFSAGLSTQPVADHWELGTDTRGYGYGLPLGATGLRARCDLDTTTHWGQTLTYPLWALQALL